MAVFDANAGRYDKWYQKNKFAYFSELNLLKSLVPAGKCGLEVGVGTGRFAQKLETRFGIDPSFNMLKVAKERGVTGVAARGEEIPFKDKVFDYLSIIIAVSFVAGPEETFAEAARVLKEKGEIIAAIIDKDSFLGRFYQRKKSIFYQQANLFSLPSILRLLEVKGFGDFSFRQAVFRLPAEMTRIEKPEVGFGKGGFVAVKGTKK